MQIYLQEFLAYLDEKGVKYTEQNDHVVKVTYTGDNLDTIPVFVIFDQDGDPYVQFKCWNIANFKNNEAKGINICNKLNSEYRWVKFYIDSDVDVIASIDAMIDMTTCGEECLSLVRRVVNIVDDSYPDIAKARWA